MPIIRKKLSPDDVYPSDIRYDEETDTVQRNVNGEWEDSPESDPRKQTTIPARVTVNAECDAAQSVADAFENQISEILTAIDNGGTAFTIAGIILSLFTFGPFGVFISIALAIADAMLDAGTTAIEAALPPTAFEDFKCILRCQFKSNGRLQPDGLAQISTEVNDQIGGLGAIILNAMCALAGEGGINNLAALGTATGDCDECGGCGWCFTWLDGALPDGWIMTIRPDGALTTYSGGKFVGGLPTGGGAIIADVQISYTGSVRQIKVAYEWNRTEPAGGSNDFVILVNGGIVHTSPNLTGAGNDVATVDGVWDDSTIELVGGVFNSSAMFNITKIQFRGTGDNPFGTNNC